MDPAGKIAVVTGGNSGLGEGAAKHLLTAGATVVSCDIGGEVPAGVDFVRCNVADERQVAAAVAEIVQRHGKIDILLNNAGIGGLGPIATPDGPGDLGAFRAVIEVNLLGAATVAAHVAHRMIATRRPARTASAE
jgi:NAD(P)-dependent dehydrogenase (short-subunit alcohol dehydrogenase family)